MVTLAEAPVRIAARERLVDVDLVRVVGLAAVVLGHVVSVGPVGSALYAFHVPLFFLLTGYLWRPGRPLGREVASRARTLLVPYACWLVILVVTFVVAAPLLRGEPVEWYRAEGALYGGVRATRPFSAFWFVSVLFGAAVLTRVLDRLPVAARWAVGVGGLAAGTALGPALAALPLAAGLVLPATSFVLIGRLLPVVLRSVRWRLLTGIACVVAGEVPVLAGWTRPLNLKIGDFGTPVLSILPAVAITAGLLLIAQAAAPRLPLQIRAITTRLAGYGMMIVLTHAAVLLVLETPPEGRPLDLMAALVVPVVAAVLVGRTRLRKPLLG